MGAWNHGPFDNDDASDFLYALEESSQPLLLLQESLTAAASCATYLEVPEGSAAIASAAVVATSWSGRVQSVSDDLSARISKLGLARDVIAPLVPLASAALTRVSQENSELLELWTEAGEAEPWLSSLSDIQGGFAEIA